MKNILFAAFCLGVFVSYFFALKTGDAGAGVILGAPAGVEDKARAGRTRAGTDDYFRYSWTVLPLSAKGKLPVYLDLRAAGVLRAEPTVAVGKLRKISGGDNAAERAAGITVKNAGFNKSVGRKKRVSKLRDPGEAMGGEIYTEIPTKAAVPVRQKK